MSLRSWMILRFAILSGSLVALCSFCSQFLSLGSIKILMIAIPVIFLSNVIMLFEP